MPSHALLIIAHGSRREASNQEVRRLAEKLAALSEDFAPVQATFLEIASPSIPAGLQACVDQGAQNITVVPYFLGAGKHVSQDIPKAIEAFRQAHPAISIYLGDYLGLHPDLPAMVLELAKATTPKRR